MGFGYGGGCCGGWGGYPGGYGGGYGYGGGIAPVWGLFLKACRKTAECLLSATGIHQCLILSSTDTVIRTGAKEWRWRANSGIGRIIGIIEKEQKTFVFCSFSCGQTEWQNKKGGFKAPLLFI